MRILPVFLTFFLLQASCFSFARAEVQEVAPGRESVNPQMSQDPSRRARIEQTQSRPCAWVPRVGFINGINTTDFSAYRQALLARDTVRNMAGDIIGGCPLRGNFAPTHQGPLGSLDALKAYEDSLAEARGRDRDGDFSGYYFNASTNVPFASVLAAVPDAAQTGLQVYGEEFVSAATSFVTWFSDALPKITLPGAEKSLNEIFAEESRKALTRSVDEAKRPDDLLQIGAAWREWLDAGPLFHVGYSQGSAYGAVLIEDLGQGYSERIRALHVASPVNKEDFTAFDAVTILKEDTLIALLPGASDPTVSNIDDCKDPQASLWRNPVKAIGDAADDATIGLRTSGHNLAEDYLGVDKVLGRPETEFRCSVLPSREAIRAQVRGAIYGFCAAYGAC